MLLTLLVACYDTLVFDSRLDLVNKVAHVEYELQNVWEDSYNCTAAPACVEAIQKDLDETVGRLVESGATVHSKGVRYTAGQIDVRYAYSEPVRFAEPDGAGFTLIRRQTKRDLSKGLPGADYVAMVTLDEPSRSETTRVQGNYEAYVVPGEKTKRVWVFRGKEATVHTEWRSLDEQGQVTKHPLWADKIEGLEAALDAAGLLVVAAR